MNNDNNSIVVWRRHAVDKMFATKFVYSVVELILIYIYCVCCFFAFLLLLLTAKHTYIFISTYGICLGSLSCVNCL